MPSNYIPPDATVTQQRVVSSTPRLRPQLPVCIIGPSRQIEVDQIAGTYSAGTQLTTALPNLAAAATVDPTTILVKFDAVDALGASIGTFQLHVGTDVLLSSDNSVLTIPASLQAGLEYSLFSSRNNNLDTLDDDTASGTADGIFLDDSSLDFDSLGVVESLTVGSILVVKAPVLAAGRYRVAEKIRDASGSATAAERITRLRLEKLNTSGYLEIHNRFLPTGALGAGTTELRGYQAPTSGTAHIRGVSSGTAAPLANINVTSGGLNYSSTPTVVLSGGGAVTQATAAAVVVGGVVVQINLLTPGAGYTSVPTVTISGGGGSGASAVAVVASNFVGFASPRNVGTTSGWVLNATGVDFNTVTAMSQARSLDDAETTTPFGIGVEACTLHISGGNLTAVLTTDGTTAHATPVKIPETTSSAAVTLAPGAPLVAGSPYGSNAPLWKSLLTTAKVGDWLRLTGGFGKTPVAPDTWTSLFLDYKITAIDQVNGTISVVNPDGLASSTATLNLTSANVSAISLLRCFAGRNDGPNLNGDFVRFTAGGATYSIEILDVAPYRITLAAPLPAGVSGATSLEIHRGIRAADQEIAYDLRQVVTTGYSGPVTVSYEAARSDLAANGVMEVASRDEIEATLGMIHPRNPLALGADMATRTGGANGTTVIFVVSVDSDTVDGYAKALETVGNEEAYFIVPLSQDKDVLDLVSAHVSTQSQPLNKHERRAYISTALRTSDPILPQTGTTALQGNVGYTGSGPYTPIATQFNGPGVNWALVQPGQMLSVLTTSDTGSAVLVQRRIRSVNTVGQYCTVYEAFPASVTDPDGNTATVPPTVYFKIDTYPYSKSQQAEIWRDEAKGYGNPRLSMVRPEACYLTYTDKTGPSNVDIQIRAPMHFGCAALAGYHATLSPSQPLTNTAVPGIDKLDTSNTYFGPDQLNTIAEGGNLILVQASRGSSTTIRHQLTTDMTSIETREVSINVAMDYTAKYYRESYRPYIGKNNITAELLTQLRGIGESVNKALVDSRIIGRGSRFVDLTQNADRPDSVDIKVRGQPLYPCNAIDITLNVG